MILSRTNQKIKELRALADKKYRDSLNRYVVEGLNSVKDAFLHGEAIIELFLTEKGYSLLQGAAPDILLNKYEILSDDLFKYVSDEVSPQGVIAVVAKKSAKPQAPTGNCLFLDGVSDPANVGAIIRTAAASGFLEVYIANGADAYSPKAVRASMGGIFRVKVYAGSREELLGLINIPVAVADMGGENIFTAKPPKTLCLAIGNEAHGVSPQVRARANITLSIPMQNGMESLNAAVSAGILMYLLSRYE